MVDEPENLMLVFLRRLDAKMDSLAETMRGFKQRLTAVELGLAAVRCEVAGLAEADAHLSARIDKMSDRLRMARAVEFLPSLLAPSTNASQSKGACSTPSRDINGPTPAC